MPLFVRRGNLRVCNCYGVAENLAVDVLFGMSFVDRCIWGIYPSEQKIVPWHFRPEAIISMRKKVHEMTDSTEEVDVHTMADSETPTESIIRVV